MMNELDRLRSHLFNEISALRDEVAAYEDAEGIAGNTAEKNILDRCLNSLRLERRSSRIFRGKA